MTKVINRKKCCFLTLFRYSCFLFHGTEKVSNDGQDPYEEVEWINTNALTIVLVRVTMLDPCEMSRDNGSWGWYRFVGAAGARMPDKCISRYKCNTVLSGWSNDDHPSEDDNEISRRVCFSQLP